MTSDQFGLPETTRAGLRNLLSTYPEVERAILYGSRAIGNYRANSDIDLTLIGKDLSLSKLLLIANDIDDLLLPYKVDLSLKDQIDNPQLIEHINRVGVVFYSKNPPYQKHPSD